MAPMTHRSLIASVGLLAAITGAHAAAVAMATFEDMLAKEVPIGSTGATGRLGKYALAVKNLLGARIKLVAGYQGSAIVKLAINRGEVHGICGLSMSSVTSQWRDEVQSGGFQVVLQLNGKAPSAA